VPGRVGEGAVGDAARCLLNGGVVLVPTDTVYGLAVHPEQDEAISRLFAMKGRPRSVNLPVMIASRDEIAGLGGVVSPAAERLMDSKFFPGPLTLAVEVSPARAARWLRGREEVAVRMPDDEQLLAILKVTGPLLVTSANLHAEEIRESVPDIVASLDGEPDLVLDGGVRATIPSTIVNCRLVPPVVERVGAILKEEIEAILE
jgi:L-threonylcarbamoyladenylate synthase